MARHRATWTVLIVTFALLIVGRFAAAASAEPPNILLIMVDDLGKEWIGCYGAEGIQTPNIDALAEGGMRFENAWCMPQCTPTRVTLLTGQYPFRHGWTNHWDVPRWGAKCHFDPKLNNSYALILRKAGYATCAAGKWQIDDFRVEPRAMDEAGFDEWCMWTGYETGNRPSGKRYWDAYINTPEGSKTYEGKFGPDVYCDYLIDFMGRHRDTPMLLYLPMALTHNPLTTTPDEPDAPKGQRHQAMVRYTDKLVGKLVEELDRLGIRDRTIVIFTTDNGTGGKSNTRNGHVVRGSKMKMNEAGTAMPFIVNCPGRVPAGVVTNALTDFTDILPTFAELAGAELPDEHVVDGHSIAKLITGKAKDSPRDWIMSMGGGPATLRDGRVAPKRAYDDRVVRDKRFKLWIGTGRKPNRLFDMIADPWEQNNLLRSTDPEVIAARKKLEAVAAGFPEQDAWPRYHENPPQKWDRK